MFISLLMLSSCWFDFYHSALAFRKGVSWSIKWEVLHETPQILTAYKKKKSPVSLVILHAMSSCAF